MIAKDQEQQIGIDSGVLAWVDSDTNLMWEVKNRDNINAMYTWHKRYKKEGLSQNNKWLNPDLVDCHSFVEKMNRERYAGFDDWRLPTKDELISLVAQENENLKIKAPLSASCPAYWSDTPTFVVNMVSFTADWKLTGHIEGIRIVDFKQGEEFEYKPENTLWLRCVRNA